MTSNTNHIVETGDYVLNDWGEWCKVTSVREDGKVFYFADGTCMFTDELTDENHRLESEMY